MQALFAAYAAAIKKPEDDSGGDNTSRLICAMLIRFQVLLPLRPRSRRGQEYEGLAPFGIRAPLTRVGLLTIVSVPRR